MTKNLHDKMLAAIDAYFSASDAVEEEVAENLLLDVRDEINKHKLAEQPAQTVSHAIIAGALFDFMGYLTSRKERIVLSASDEASPAADAIKDFATKRGLSLDEAQVREWTDALAEQPAQQEPVAWMQDSIELYVQDRPSATYTIPLYTSPQAQPAREWVGLTKEDKAKIVAATERDDRGYVMALVESKLKEKNHG